MKKHIAFALATLGIVFASPALATHGGACPHQSGDGSVQCSGSNVYTGSTCRALPEPVCSAPRTQVDCGSWSCVCPSGQLYCGTAPYNNCNTPVSCTGGQTYDVCANGGTGGCVGNVNVILSPASPVYQNGFISVTAGGAPGAPASGVVAANGMSVDNLDQNSGVIASNSLRFGGTASGEGIFSKRTAGGNQWGLDLVTNSISRMSVTSGGNVGIGTNAPGRLLQVGNNTGTPIVRVSGGNPGGGSLELVGGTNYINLGFDAALFGGSAMDLSLSAPLNNGTRFYTNSSERMRITSAGNVGIGTTNPTGKLDVSVFDSTTTGNYTYALNLSAQQSGATAGSDNLYGISASVTDFGAHTGGTNWMYGGRFTANSTTDTANYMNAVGLSGLAQNGDENTGVMGHAYSSRLNGLGYAVMAYMDGPLASASTGGRHVGVEVVGWGTYAGTSGGPGKYGIKSELRSVQWNGTSYSGYFLNQTTNDATVDGRSKYGLYVSSTGAFAGGAGAATNNYGLFVGTPSGADNNYAAIFAGGNVGIGTTTPTSALDVVGTVKMTGFQLGAATTAGYVLTADAAGVGTWQIAPGAGGGVGGSGTINYVPKFTAASAVGNSLMFDNGTTVAIGTAAPSTAKFQVKDGAVLFDGAVGATPASGTGTRLMWIPAKAAFRAGQTQSTEWDDANVGANSVALNIGTLATGSASMAVNFYTDATGSYAFAAGNGTVASGYASTAFGNSNTASGSRATVMGFNSTSSGNHTLASGYYAAAGPGQSAVALGHATTASGAYSFTNGLYTSATASNAMSMGHGADAANYLANGIMDSMMIGFNSNLPTLFVGPSAGLNTTGNVGISTSTPGAKLQIDHDGASTFGVALKINQRVVGNSDGPKIEFYKTMTSSVNWTVGMADGLNVGDFAISSGAGTGGFGTKRMVIDTSGNTTFNGTSLNAVYASSEGPRINLRNPNKPGLGNEWSIYNMTGVYGDSLQFWNYGGAGWGSKLTISDSGNLTTPGAVYASNWFRSYGATGWYSETYGGGWHMLDSTWIRAYGDKPVYTTNVMRADNGFQVDGNAVIDGDAGWHRTYGATGWYNGTYGGGWHMSDSTWIRSYGSKPVYMDYGYDSGSPSGVQCGGGLGGGYTFHVCGSAKVDSDLYMGSGQTIRGTDRLHISSGQDIYLLPTGGSVVVSAAWGGTADLYVDGNWTFIGGGGAAAYIGGDGCCDVQVGSTGSSSQVHFWNWNSGWMRTRAAAYDIGSSIRWKKDIVDIDGALDRVTKLKGVFFNWKEDAMEFDKDRRQVGFIAEEVYEVLPEVVQLDKDAPGYAESVDYSKLTPLLVEAVKELSARTLRVDEDGDVVVAADLAADANLWGDGSGWISCQNGRECSCPEGSYVTKIKPRDDGTDMFCNEF